ncbi:hypothetical protein [Mesorhizobium sp. M1365]|uniref:ORC-CDC6 family AAA ATPase n=1 Tax=Mesorhizobium sp. M1365 TaxID=2957090 RepID=UPI003338DFBE
MNDYGLNPFRPTRWEHHRDGRPLIWFTSTAEELAGDKSVFVYGGRGVGKTTLLKAICWEDLSQNESLRLQRKLADFQHLGIYVRFPDHVSASMSHHGWEAQFPRSPNPVLEYHRFFSLAVELTCAERALDACHSLRVLGSVIYQPSQELRIVEDCATEYPEIATFSNQAPRTFLELARVFRIIVRRMNEACGRGSVAAFVETLPAREPYQLLSFLMERLAESVHLVTQFEPRSISFKFCLDDCEALSFIQRKSLNTLVRLSRAPISWVISSVGSVQDDSDTFIEAQPLTDADRRVLSLDSRDTIDFKALCQSVVSLRLLFSLPKDQRTLTSQEEISRFFDLDQRLGSRDVNEMMGQLVSRSHRPLAAQVKSAAEHLLRAVRKIDPRSARKFDIKGGRLPYYEAYLLLHWRGREEAFSASFGPEDIARLDQYGTIYSDQAFNAWIRRKQQNALLHFAASLRARRIPLAGANVVIALADSSIRDFLEVMGEIFEKYGDFHKLDSNDPANLARFVTSRSQISAQIQNDGIYSASEKYLDGIAARSEIDSDVVGRLVNGLGYLTAFLQSNPGDPRVFGAAERGVFLIDYPPASSQTREDEYAFVQAAFKQAVLAGYFRIVETPRAVRAVQADNVSKALAFRLHRRFAPHFRFSYRGAYEAVRLTPNEISQLCLKPEELSPFAWAKIMAGMAGKFGDAQIALPFRELHDDF